MPQHEAPTGFMIQMVFDSLRSHPGTVFLIEDICRQTGCSLTQAQVALETLVQHSMISQEQIAGGKVAYVYRLFDPRSWYQPSSDAEP
jgi:hypothetical protein